MSHGFRVYATLAAITLFPNMARAEEPRYGLQLHVNLPGGDLKTSVDSQPGAGLGAHVTFDLGKGHVIRPRFDAVFFSGAFLPGFKTKATDLSLGADYLYFPGGTPQGFYLMGGLGLHRWTVDTTIPAIGSYPAFSGTKTSTRFGYSGGLGYNFNRSFGAELRLVNTKYSSGIPAWDRTANNGQASVMFRF